MSMKPTGLHALLPELNEAQYKLLERYIETATEIFVPIRGYEGLYEVSNTGKVRSVRGGKRQGVELKHSITPLGYHRLQLCKDRKSTSYFVHRLVAETFVTNEYNKPEANHIDGNKSNNAATNLNWMTSRENKLHTIYVLRAGKVVPKSYDDRYCVVCSILLPQRPSKRGKYCSLKCMGVARRKPSLAAVEAAGTSLKGAA
jgi:hypothetical protein